MTMRGNRCNFDFMACRRYFWLASVVFIALGLIANILMGVRMDIRFTGGTMLRYSYPESGIVSSSDIPVLPESTLASGSQVDNTSPEPADEPVIISGGDVSSGDLGSSGDSISDTEVPGVNNPAGTVSGADVSVESASVDYSTDVDPFEAARIISEAVGEEVTVQISTDANTPSGGENKRLLVTFDRHIESGDEIDELIRGVMEMKYPNVSLTLRETTSVDQSIGGEFVGRCAAAIILALTAVMLYIGLRFRGIGGWTAAASAIIAILHDCLAAYFAFVLFRFPISDRFIAVELAIIGHSLNSTIVVFDRIRENKRLPGGSRSLAELANRSINESLSRTVSTDLCVFIAVAVLAVVSAIYGLNSMLGFAVPMMFGLAAGCYSSLCIAVTIWVAWQEGLEKHRVGRKSAPREH